MLFLFLNCSVLFACKVTNVWTERANLSGCVHRCVCECVCARAHLTVSWLTASLKYKINNCLFSCHCWWRGDDSDINVLTYKKKKNLRPFFCFAFVASIKQCEVCCSPPWKLYSATALIKQLSGRQPVPALAAQWLANGHTETQIRVTESFVGRETQLTQVRAWTLRNHDKQKRTFLLLWKGKQFKVTHLYTTMDQESEENMFKKGKMLIIFIFFPECIIQLQV